ncbi:MAG: hypothetical protein AB9891_03075 [Anaerolineaceae bacterium]
MRKKGRLFIFGMVGIIAAIIFLAVRSPVSGTIESPLQNRVAENKRTSPCISILLEAAGKTGVNGEIVNIGDSDDGNGFYSCMLTYVISSENGSDATKTSLSLISSQPTIEASCEFTPLEQFSLTTFNGYNAQTYYQKGETRMVNDVPFTYERKDLTWCMYKGDRSHHLSVWTDTQSIEKYGAAREPVPIANILLAIAEERLPLTPQSSGVMSASPYPQNEQGYVTENPIGPADPSTSSEDGGLFDIPFPIALGSVAVPLAGAFTGAAFSALWAVYASKNIPPQVTDAANKAANYAATMTQLARLHAQLQQINQELLDQNTYVANPYQGDPTLIADGLSKGGNWLWDNTAGWVTGSKGITCQGYREATFTKVQNMVHEQIPGARLQNIKFEEKSTIKTDKGMLDWLDSCNDDNHDLSKLIMPDGSEWSIDFQQHNTGKRPPILRPWKDARGVWKEYMGDEFSERISIEDK